MSYKRVLTVPQENIISVDTPNRDRFFEQALSDESKQNVLGRGSFGTVVKAVYKDKQAAVKIIDSCSETKMWSLKNESNVLGWQHENIIKILKIVSTPVYSIIIMERFPGQCLQFVLDNIVIPVMHRIWISIDICNALIYCHGKGLIHYDVKPQNILIAYLDMWQFKTIDNQNIIRMYICKLCDFGSSLLIEKGLNENNTLNRGTVRYMSPEILKRSNVTTASDIYSFGITMWQLKTRIYPYSSIESNDIVAFRVVKENLRPDHPNLIQKFKNSNTHSNCLCEYFSSDLSKHSIENLQQILNSSSKSLESSRPLLNLFNENKRIPFANLNHRFNIQSCNNMNDRNLFPKRINKNTNLQKNNSFNTIKTRNMQYQNISIKITTENGDEKFHSDHEKENSNFHSTNAINRKLKISSLEKNIDLENIFSSSTPVNHGNTLSPHSKQMITNEIENDIEILYKNCWDDDDSKRPSAHNIRTKLKSILIRLS